MHHYAMMPLKHRNSWLKIGERLQIDTQIKIKIIKPHSDHLVLSWLSAADPTDLHSPEAMHVA